MATPIIGISKDKMTVGKNPNNLKFAGATNSIDDIFSF